MSINAPGIILLYLSNKNLISARPPGGDAVGDSPGNVRLMKHLFRGYVRDILPNCRHPVEVMLSLSMRGLLDVVRRTARLYSSLIYTIIILMYTVSLSLSLALHHLCLWRLFLTGFWADRFAKYLKMFHLTYFLYYKGLALLFGGFH